VPGIDTAQHVVGVRHIFAAMYDDAVSHGKLFQGVPESAFGRQGSPVRSRRLRQGIPESAEGRQGGFVAIEDYQLVDVQLAKGGKVGAYVSTTSTDYSFAAEVQFLEGGVFETQFSVEDGHIWRVRRDVKHAQVR